MSLLAILNGGPADLRELILDVLEQTLQVDGETYYLAYDSRTEEPQEDAFGRLQYRWEWPEASRVELERNQPPNSKGER